MKKKLIALLLSMTMVTSLVACGSSDTATTTETTTATETEEVAEEAATEVASEVHLKMVISIPRFEDQFTTYFDQFCVKYEEENGVKVTYELELPEDNTSAVLQTRLTTGDQVDIYALHALQDLPQYAAAGYVESMEGEEWVDKMFDSAITAVSYQGEAMGVLLESFEWGYLYNKDIFAEVGITEFEQMPTTLTEMEELCNTLVDAGYTPFVLSYKDIPWTYWPMQLSKGAMCKSQDDLLDWFSRMNQSDASFAEIEGLFDAVNLANEYGDTTKALDMSTDDGVAAFALGQGAMIITGPWYAESILAVNPDMNFGMGALPVSEDPDECMINSSASTMLVVNSASENKEVAAALLGYFLDDEDSMWFYDACVFNPVTQTQNDNMVINPWVLDGKDWVNAGKYYMDDETTPSTCVDDIASMAQAWFAGELTDEGFIEKADGFWHDSNSALGEQEALE
ncbi:MAG: extracellular solute-binding protein [Eubacteriales bacterium]